MFLGLSLFDASVLKWNTGLVLWTLLFAFIFRPIGPSSLLFHCDCINDSHALYTKVLAKFCYMCSKLCYDYAGVVVLTLIMNIFRLHKIGLRDTFILVGFLHYREFPLLCSLSLPLSLSLSLSLFLSLSYTELQWSTRRCSICSSTDEAV